MTETLDLSTYSAALDVPDSRDYTHTEVYGEYGGGDLPSRVMLNLAPNLNQGSIGACTIFGSTNGYNETLAQRCKTAEVPYAQPYDPWTAWDECKRRGASDQGGWIFQSALQVLKDLGYIGAYVNINTNGFANVDTMKRIIASGKAIATGVKYADWAKIRQTGEYERTTKLGGHIFSIDGYDDNYVFANGKIGGFYSENNWGGIGKFYIAYADVNVLYSQYEFLLTDEQEKFLHAKKKRKNAYLEKAYERGIWNEARPGEIASATEIQIMVHRAMQWNNPVNERRVVYYELFKDKIIRDKMISIYNGENKFATATAHEIAIMFTRAVMRNPGINELVLSREQVADIIGRDFL